VLGHIGFRFSAPLPANASVCPQKIPHKSLFYNNVPITALFLLLCDGNASYPQQNKDLVGGGYPVPTRLETRLHCVLMFSTSSGLSC
jgi:hypothetical protein